MTANELQKQSWKWGLQGWGYRSLVMHLPIKHKALDSIPSTTPQKNGGRRRGLLNGSNNISFSQKRSCREPFLKTALCRHRGSSSPLERGSWASGCQQGQVPEVLAIWHFTFITIYVALLAQFQAHKLWLIKVCTYFWASHGLQTEWEKPSALGMWWYQI